MGIDVFNADGHIDWKKVKNAGNGFGICKATEGLHLTDARLKQNLDGLQAAGMVRGAYHFFLVGLDPVQQAAHFLNALQSAGYDFAADLPPALDLEDRHGAAQFGQRRMRHDVSAFLQHVEATTHKRCLIYLDTDFGQNILGDGYGGHPLWIASIQPDKPNLPTFWQDWTFWQHDFNGTVPGCPNPNSVDLDNFNGSEEDLRAFALKTM